MTKYIKQGAALIAALYIALVFSACTFVRVETPAMTATYVDIHLGGNAVEATADLNGLGTIDLKRNTETVEGVVESVGDAVNPIPFVE